MEIYKDYSDSYQFSNRRFKLCLYILVDSGLNAISNMHFSERGYICTSISVYKYDHSVP